MKRLALVLAGAFVVACGGPAEVRVPPPVAPTASPPPAPPDPLGARPDPAAADPFTPPVPVSYKRPNGLTVWLLERHALPVVSLEVVVPSGAANDPAGKGGLAVATAGMLDEGAGSRGPLEIARDIDRLGATLHTGAYTDYSYAHLSTLKRNLTPAAAILGDVVGRPRFLDVEWKRMKDLWTNELKARATQPAAVCGIVMNRVLFGDAHPYGHPTNGTLASSAKISLDDVRKFYAGTWNPESATLVVVGDVTRLELDALLDQVLVAWKPAAPPLNLYNVGRLGALPPATKGPRVIVVDRPDAPQSMVAVARAGVAAGDPGTAPLVRANAALGGSFTSRLNQDLREEHGWTYGASSRFAWSKLEGIFSAQAAVETAHTGDALKAMTEDLRVFAKDGLTDEEVAKTRLLARGELVDAFEKVDAATTRLARNAGVGLPPDHEAKASQRVAAATKDDLGKLARERMDPAHAITVIVGPRAVIEPQLRAIGVTSIETRGPEGEQ